CDRVARRGERELLARDLEERSSVDVHWWQFVDPCARVERWIRVDDRRHHGIGLAKVRACALEPSGAGPVVGLRAALGIRHGPGHLCMLPPAPRATWATTSLDIKLPRRLARSPESSGI